MSSDNSDKAPEVGPNRLEVQGQYHRGDDNMVQYLLQHASRILSFGAFPVEAFSTDDEGVSATTGIVLYMEDEHHHLVALMPKPVLREFVEGITWHLNRLEADNMDDFPPESNPWLRMPPIEDTETDGYFAGDPEPGNG